MLSVIVSGEIIQSTGWRGSPSTILIIIKIYVHLSGCHYFHSSANRHYMFWHDINDWNFVYTIKLKLLWKYVLE